MLHNCSTAPRAPTTRLTRSATYFFLRAEYARLRQACSLPDSKVQTVMNRTSKRSKISNCNLSRFETRDADFHSHAKGGKMQLRTASKAVHSLLDAFGASKRLEHRPVRKGTSAHELESSLDVTHCAIVGSLQKERERAAPPVCLTLKTK